MLETVKSIFFKLYFMHVFMVIVNFILRNFWFIAKFYINVLRYKSTFKTTNTWNYL